MPRRTPRLSQLTMLMTCAAILLALVSAGSALAAGTSIGELTRFGGPGNGNGKFDLTEPTHAFGVDTTDGGVYVGDEPVKGEANPGIYRVQKLGSKGEFLGATTFKEKCEVNEKVAEGHKCAEEGGEEGIEGIAFDTVESERRLYVLSGFERAAGGKVDIGKNAAGVLYAFSTTPKEEGGEKKLVPIAGVTEGVLDSPEALNARSSTQGAALLEPRGIAVDPTTHEVIIAGVIDKGIGVGPEFGEHLALQRVTAKGALGARYVDPEREVHNFAAEANSPVVTQTGIILMQQEEKIIQIPSDFTSKTAPKTVFQLSPRESIIEFGEEFEERGATLAIAPEEGNAGTLYAAASIAPTGKGTANEGVLAFHYETNGQEINVGETGWMAGASEAGGSHCVIGFEGEFEEPMIATGLEKKVFVLEPGRNTTTPEPAVVEFGPAEKPEGCPKAEASEPQATVEGVKVTKVKEGKEVKLSSTITGANALSVEWSFGDGTSKTVSTEEFEETTVTHAFAKAGTLTVTETINDDDLATPVLTKTMKITVEANTESAPAITKQPSNVEVEEGHAATFEATASGSPTPTVQWEESIDGGTTWKARTGATATKLSIASAKASESGDKFRAVFTNSAGGSEHHVTTGAATLTVKAEVQAPPAITKQPSNVEVEEGHAATFEATASGKPEPTVQWEESVDGGTTWKARAGATAMKLTIASPTTSESGHKFRATFTNSAGGSEHHVTTEAATLTVKAKSSGGGGGNGGGGGSGGGTGSGGGAGGGATGTGEVLGTQGSSPPPPPPNATIAGTSATVSKAGAFVLKLTCPVGETSCSGTVTLQTLTAVSARASSAAKKRILTLALGSFSVAGGQVKAITLHLSATARKLLAKSRTLKAKATIAAHDPAGAKHTAVATITLRAAKH